MSKQKKQKTQATKGINMTYNIFYHTSVTPYKTKIDHTHHNLAIKQIRRVSKGFSAFQIPIYQDITKQLSYQIYCTDCNKAYAAVTKHDVRHLISKGMGLFDNNYDDPKANVKKGNDTRFRSTSKKPQLTREEIREKRKALKEST